MATKKEEKEFEKERKAAIKARYKKMKEEGLEKYLTPEQISYNRRRRAIGMVWPFFRFLILFGLCFVILYPLIFMLSTAFRPNEQMNDPSVVWIPKSFTLDNIKDVWGVMKFEDTVVNTVILNLVASVLQVITCSITGYGFARFKFKGKGILFGIVVLMIIHRSQLSHFTSSMLTSSQSGSLRYSHLANQHRLSTAVGQCIFLHCLQTDSVQVCLSSSSVSSSEDFLRSLKMLHTSTAAAH